MNSLGDRTKRKQFVYKQHDYCHQLELKPYCFKWIFLYRIKELYLWIFSLLFIPFLRVARSLNYIEEGKEVSLEEIVDKCLKPVELR